MALLQGGNIANIERVKIVTQESTSKTYTLDTATSASFTGVLSEGAETELRVKNTIHGLIRTEDLVKGYDIEIEDQTLIMQVLALIDGGEYTDGPNPTYTAPAAGVAVERTKFDLFLYTSDRDTDGSAESYHEWKFPSCKGKPVDGAFTDGEFAKTTYKITSRPASGESPMAVARVSELPAA